MCKRQSQNYASHCNCEMLLLRKHVNVSAYLTQRTRVPFFVLNFYFVDACASERNFLPAQPRSNILAKRIETNRHDEIWRINLVAHARFAERIRERGFSFVCLPDVFTQAFSAVNRLLPPRTTRRTPSQRSSPGRR